MYVIGSITIVLIAGLGMMDDLYRGKISNGLILSGLLLGAVYQIQVNGIPGSVIFLGGFLFPMVVMFGLYFFRMIGAGDIKLLSVIGGFVGPVQICCCMGGALVIGAVIAVGILYKKQIFMERMKFLLSYINNCIKNKQRVPYLPQVREEGRFCFSIPIFLAVVLQVIHR